MKELRISAKIENLETMIDFILNSINEVNNSNKFLGKLRLVSEEILVNIIIYAYPKTTGDILIKIEVTDNTLNLDIIDWGIPFNPIEKENPDINLPLEERTIGGLGIFMVKNIMDEIKYDYSENKNILSMKKKLSL